MEDKDCRDKEELLYKTSINKVYFVNGTNQTKTKKGPFLESRARKAISKTTTYLFCKAGLLICFKGNKNKNNCKVSCFETHSVLKVQRELCHPKYARKVSGLSRNRPLDWKVFGFFHVQVHPFAWSPVVRLLWKLGQAGILIPVWKLSRSETRSHIFYSIVHRQMVLTCSHENGIDSGIYWKPKK